jgi:hypothetical protein
MKAINLICLCIALATQLMAVEEGSFDRTISISGPVELDVKTASGGITVTHGSPGAVRIHAILKADEGWFSSGDVAERMRELEKNPPVEQNGNRVRLGYLEGGRELLKGISIRFEIQTPPDTRVQASSSSGGIRVDGVHGPVDCKTSSGGIEVHDIAGDVHASSSSGGQHIRNIKGAVFDRSSSGGIEALEVAGALDAEASSGSLRLGQTVAAPIRVRTASGGVTVELARNSGYDLSVATGSGSMTIPEMTVNSSFSRHHIEGKVRSGGPMVSIRTASGSVRID